jgi:hypothetical protein
MSLSDKIWTTRKSRIYAEKRLHRNAILSQVLMTIYSASLVFLSIWNTLHPNDQVNVALIFSSIAVLVTSIVLSSQRYNERSLAMRNCYIRLDELYSKARNAEQKNENTLLQQIESEYTTALLNVENHTDYDYLRLRFSLRNNQNTTLPAFTKIDYLRYFWENFWRGLLITSCLLLPGLLVLLWNVVRNVGIQ